MCSQCSIQLLYFTETAPLHFCMCLLSLLARIGQTSLHVFLFLDTPTGGYMSEDQCSDMSGDQPQSMQTGGYKHIRSTLPQRNLVEHVQELPDLLILVSNTEM